MEGSYRVRPTSVGFRPGRSAHDAVYQAREYISQSSIIAVDLDLEKFFDTVTHDVLMWRVARKVQEKRVLRLIGRFLRAGVCIDGRLRRTPKGVPQGGSLSPMLSNILLDESETELERRGHRVARYADDLVIFVTSVRAGERVRRSLTRFLDKTRKLRGNEAKSQVRPTDHLECLGVTFKTTSIRWSEGACQEFTRRGKRLTGRRWGVSTGLRATHRRMAFRLKTLAEYIRGWMTYFGISEYYRPIPELDQWLRRRIRMCDWRQWRNCRTNARNLLKRGGPLKAAIAVGMSRKSFWHLSKTYATQLGICLCVPAPVCHRQAQTGDNSVVERTRGHCHQRPVGEHARPGYGPVTCRNAPCGPAPVCRCTGRCGVLWGLEVKHLRLPD
jgi:RNA-directed DNA polymerase